MSIQFNVPSELYGQTVAVVSNLETAINYGFAPCADGSDYYFSMHEQEQLKTFSDESQFTPSFELDFPLNLVALCQPVENRLNLPSSVRFTSKEYAALKSVMLNQGGKYKNNGFVFEESSEDIYWRILDGGDLNRKKRFQFFATPEDLATELVQMAEIDDLAQVSILEPSAGDGALVRKILQTPGFAGTVSGYELMPLNREKLQNISDFNLLGSDFLEADDTKFERIIANPPFSKNQDIVHIRKMYEKLADNGVMVSVVSQGWQTNQNRIAAEFRDFLVSVNAQIIPLDAGRFKESGTNIASCVIKIRK